MFNRPATAPERSTRKLQGVPVDKSGRAKLPQRGRLLEKSTDTEQVKIPGRAGLRGLAPRRQGQDRCDRLPPGSLPLAHAAASAFAALPVGGPPTPTANGWWRPVTALPVDAFAGSTPGRSGRPDESGRPTTAQSGDAEDHNGRTGFRFRAIAAAVERAPRQAVRTALRKLSTSAES